MRGSFEREYLIIHNDRWVTLKGSFVHQAQTNKQTGIRTEQYRNANGMLAARRTTRLFSVPGVQPGGVARPDFSSTKDKACARRARTALMQSEVKKYTGRARVFTCPKGVCKKGREEKKRKKIVETGSREGRREEG